jgi:hypothetical protein
MLSTPPAARLLVLVPEGDLPLIELAQRIWGLAAEAGAAVLLVGLAGSPEREPRTRRTLAVLATHVRFETVPVSTRVARVSNWLAAVKQLWRPGDRVVCFADEVVAVGPLGWRTQPLDEALQAQLRLAPFVIRDAGGVPLHAAGRPAGRWRQAAWWAASLALVALFLSLQAWLVTTITGRMGNVLLVVTVVGEFVLLDALYQWRLRG